MHPNELTASDCGIAQTLGVVADSWSWLVLREVAGGTTRFDAIQATLGVSRRALSERLASLVDDGVLSRVAYSEHPPRFDYVLTTKGEGLLPVLLAMQEFGDRWLLGDGTVNAVPVTGSAEAARARAWVDRTLPELVLPADDGSSLPLRAGAWRVLYLFPGAWADAASYPPGWGRVQGAAGCTLESTTYAERYARFRALGCDVAGVSTQRPDEQAAFVAHARIPFRLLSDEDTMFAASLRAPTFRVHGTERLKRVSLLADPNGVVRYVQAPVTDPAGSVDAMLKTAEALIAR